MSFKLNNDIVDYFNSLTEDELLKELDIYGLIDLEYVRFADKLNQYTYLIKNIKLSRGSGKTRFINYTLVRINVSYNIFVRHLEYLKYTNKTVNRNRHLKALHDNEALLDTLLDIKNK